MSEKDWCKHREVCGFRGGYKIDYPEYCVLHCPTNSKPAQQFEAALRKHLDDGSTDLRYIYFPEHSGSILRDREFSTLLNLSETMYSTQLDLSNTRLKKGLILTAKSTAGIILSDAIIEGDLNICVQDGVGEIRLDSKEIAGDVVIEVGRATGVTCRGTLHGRLSLRGKFASVDLQDAQLKRGVELCNCVILDLKPIQSTRFESGAGIDLSGASVASDLRIVMRGDPPSFACLEGTEIRGGVYLVCESRDRKLKLIATRSRPRFGAAATFSNIDLSECLLVGNSIKAMDFTHIKWASRYWRNVLYDEVSYRGEEGAKIPVEHMREAYEVLKEFYQRSGSQRIAGEFHYGEMEMRRREYRWLWRRTCPEAFYWLLSGYGTGYIRAGAILLGLAILCAWGYWQTSPSAFSSDFFDALRFSVSVVAFQRPAPPGALTSWGQWINVLQSILGPMQIALFVLALRMRLKR